MNRTTLLLAIVTAIALFGCASSEPKQQTHASANTNVAANPSADEKHGNSGDESVDANRPANPPVPATPTNSIAKPTIELVWPPIQKTGAGTIGGGRYALVILADEYANQPSWNLTSEADAVVTKLRPVLEGPLAVASENILVVRGSDITREAIENALLRKIGSRIHGAGNLLLIYHFGHGATRNIPGSNGADGQREVILLTHFTKPLGTNDFDPVLTQSDLAGFLSKLRQSLAERKADARIVTIVDACRVPLLPPQGPAKLLRISDADVFSASEGQFAGIGVFTDAFSSAIRAAAGADNSGEIYLDTVFNAAKSQVETATNGAQVPTIVQSLGRFPLRTKRGMAIRVVALDGHTKQPIEGASVVLNDRTLASPAVFEGVQPGRYFLQVKAANYFWRSEVLELADTDSGRTIEVPLMPEFVLVTGEIANRAGTRVAVALNTVELPTGFRSDTHQRQTEVIGSGYFSMKLPPLPTGTTFNFAIPGRSQPLATPALSQALIEFIDVHITDSPNTQRLTHINLGKFDLTDTASAKNVNDVGSGLTVGPLTFPTVSFTDAGARTIYEQAVAQARAKQLKIADDMLEGLIASGGTDATGRQSLKQFREAVRIQILLQQYTTDPDAARTALWQAIDDGVFVSERENATTQLIRWLGTKATEFERDRQFAQATVMLDQAREFANASGREMQVAVDAQRHRTYLAWVRFAVETAMTDDTWAAAETAVLAATSAFPQSDAFAPWQQTLLRERMPKAAREMIRAADDAFSAGDLDTAEQKYREALATANDHYRQHIEPQLRAVEVLQFSRYFQTASERQIAGDRVGALQNYLRAWLYRPVAVESMLKNFPRDDAELSAVWAANGRIYDEKFAFNNLPQSGPLNARIVACEAYLREFPDGRYAPEIVVRVDELRTRERREIELVERERAAYETIPTTGSIDGQIAGMESFLRQYPNGANSATVNQRLQNLKHQRDQSEMAKKERAAYDALPITGTLEQQIAAIESYLREFPVGANSPSAIHRLELLKHQQQREQEARRPTVASYTWLREESFSCGGQMHTMQIYRCDKFAQLVNARTESRNGKQYCDVDCEFVLIPAGEFMMGSPDSESDRVANEGPQHWVRIGKPFLMARTEVTQRVWQAVMGSNPSYFRNRAPSPPDTSRHPVEQVSWDDITDFNARAGLASLRLPSEAEWEYACRAGTTTRYSFGDSVNELPTYGWFASNSGSMTHAVGEKQPNAFGLFDMHGNVWEWCQDDYFGYYGAPTDGSARSIADASYRICRGGCWYSKAGRCRSATRIWHSHDTRGYDRSFRPVQALSD